MNTRRGIKGFVGVPVADRLAAHIVRGGPDDCWPWTASTDGRYGVIHVDGKRQKAHRVAWALVNGPIPDGKHICHHCDNPPCCNPAHMFLGDPALNAQDRDSKGRLNNLGNALKTHCKRGHEFTPENTYVYPENGARRREGASPARGCRICKRMLKARAKERAREALAGAPDAPEEVR
jgi:hypothetical protein